MDKIRLPKRMPSNPEVAYAGKGWKGWDDFLGVKPEEVAKKVFDWNMGLSRMPSLNAIRKKCFALGPWAGDTRNFSEVSEEEKQRCTRFHEAVTKELERLAAAKVKEREAKRGAKP